MPVPDALPPTPESLWQQIIALGGIGGAWFIWTVVQFFRGKKEETPSKRVEIEAVEFADVSIFRGIGEGLRKALPLIETNTARLDRIDVRGERLDDRTEEMLRILRDLDVERQVEKGIRERDPHRHDR